MATHKAVFWALFAAGGTLAALLVPVLVLITGLAIPLGLLAPAALSFDRVSNALDSLPVALTLLVTLVLLLWHAAHRLRVAAHDLGWFSDFVAVVLLYGLASLGTIAAALLLI